MLNHTGTYILLHRPLDQTTHAQEIIWFRSGRGTLDSEVFFLDEGGTAQSETARSGPNLFLAQFFKNHAEKLATRVVVWLESCDRCRRG
jgi:hypothetical protein